MHPQPHRRTTNGGASTSPLGVWAVIRCNDPSGPHPDTGVRQASSPSIWTRTACACTGNAVVPASTKPVGSSSRSFPPAPVTRWTTPSTSESWKFVLVPHEHGALDPQVLEPGDEVPGLGGQRDVAAPPGRDAVAEPDQLERQAPRGADAGRDVTPQSGVGGDAVHEDDGDAVALLEPAPSHTVHDRVVLLHASAFPRRRRLGRRLSVDLSRSAGPGSATFDRAERGQVACARRLHDGQPAVGLHHQRLGLPE